MLNLAALTPPILPATAGGGALPVAAPPPATAGRAFQSELQRAQHHQAPSDAGEPPPRQRPPETRREAESSRPAPRDPAGPRSAQGAAREGAPAAANGGSTAAPSRPTAARATRHPEAADAPRSGARSDTRTKAQARSEAGETPGETRAGPARTKPRHTGHELPEAPDASTAAGLAVVPIVEARTAVPLIATTRVEAATDAVAPAGVEAVTPAVATAPGTATPAVTTAPDTATPAVTTALDTDIPAVLAAATADIAASGTTATGIAAARGAAAPPTAARVAPALPDLPAVDTDAAAVAAPLPVADDAMGRLADTIARLGSEVRGRVARDTADATPAAALGSTGPTVATDAADGTGRAGRGHAGARAARGGDADPHGHGILDPLGASNIAQRAAGARRVDAPPATGAASPTAVAGADTRTAARAAALTDAAPGARTAAAADSLTAALPARDPRGTPVPVNAVGVTDPTAPVDATGPALPTLATPGATAGQDGPPSTGVSPAAALPLTGRLSISTSTSTLDRKAAAPALEASTPTAALATGPSLPREAQPDGVLPALVTAATAAVSAVAGPRVPSAPLAAAIGEPALRTLSGALQAARRAEAQADAPATAAALPAAAGALPGDGAAEPSKPRLREADATVVGPLASAEPLPRATAPLTPVTASAPPPADGSLAVVAAGPVEARAADGASGVGPTADPAAAALLTGTIDAPVDSPAFAPALGARIALFARDGIEQARLNVHPAELGPISVQLSVDGAKVRVDMTADVGTTRQALEQSLPSLASSLRDAGFTLTGGGVFQQWGQGQREGGGADPSSRTARRTDDIGDDAVSMTVTAAPARRAAGLVDVFA